MISGMSRRLFIAVILASVCASSPAAEDSAGKTKDELLKAARDGKLWRGSCRQGHRSGGFLIASERPHGGTGTACSGTLTPVGGGQAHSCHSAMKYQKATGADVEEWFKQQKPSARR
jgi:hypothetical protein